MHKWLILISLAWTVVAAEPAYRWVDENGQVHYSDRPTPGATRIELATGPAAPPPSALPVQSPQAVDAQPEPEPEEDYTLFNVLRPAQQETLWGTGNTVDVAVEIGPQLQRGHRLGYFLDGSLTDLGSGSTQFQLEGVERGIHTLQAVILDENGNEVIRTLAVTFMMQQPSINYPQSPQAPPRPTPF